MVTVIIPCAGRGERFGAEIPKQYLTLKGLPIFVRSLLAFEKHPLCDHIILGVNSDYLEKVQKILKEFSFKKIYRVVEGGETRQDTVYKALLEAPENTEIFLVHDAVRPLINQELISRVIELAKIEKGVIPVIPVRDALIRGKNGYVIESLDRTNLYQVQTPQAIQANILKETLEKAFSEGKIFPDEGSLLHHYGYKVRIIEGSLENFKITFSEDLVIAEKIISE